MDMSRPSQAELFGGRLVIGAVGAFAATRLMSSLLVEISVYDPEPLRRFLSILTGVTLVASWLRRRASRSTRDKFCLS